MLSEADKKLAKECGAGIYDNEYSFSETELTTMLDKVRESVREMCIKLHDHEDVLAPIGNSSYGEARQDGWINGTMAYREAIRNLK